MTSRIPAALPGLAALALSAALLVPAAALAQSPRDSLMQTLAAQAKAADPAFAGFSAERGRAFFLAKHTGGKPDTPSCTSCHGTDPRQAGQTRAGKTIDPMAVSANAARYTDPAKVEKWFGRNCNTVLGRACTPQEKGDFLAYMIGQ